jgi:flagellar biosynthesis/type III secretory pathway M-ring protein FliF/YscJ
MDAWIWVLVVVAVLVIAAVLFLLWRKSERVQEQKREEAGELRRESQVRAGRAAEREREAEQQAEQARAERERAESLAGKADDIDPDVDR